MQNKPVLRSLTLTLWHPRPEYSREERVFRCTLRRSVISIHLLTIQVSVRYTSYRSRRAEHRGVFFECVISKTLWHEVSDFFFKKNWMCYWQWISINPLLGSGLATKNIHLRILSPLLLCGHAGNMKMSGPTSNKYWCTNEVEHGGEVDKLFISRRWRDGGMSPLKKVLEEWRRDTKWYKQNPAEALFVPCFSGHNSSVGVTENLRKWCVVETSM